MKAGFDRRGAVSLAMFLAACGPRGRGASSPPSTPVAVSGAWASPAESEPEPASPLEPRPEREPVRMDRDADGRMDADDDCPDEPELFNDVDDDDGCPDAGPLGLALVVGHRLELWHPQIRFELDSEQPHPDSEPLVDALASLVLRNGHLGVLHVEVHTGAAGSSEHNLALTRRRARALDLILQSRGVPAERIDAQGFGEQMPISHCPDDDPRCNRRVELWFDGPGVGIMPVPSTRARR